MGRLSGGRGRVALGGLLLAGGAAILFASGAGQPDHSRALLLDLDTTGHWVSSPPFKAWLPGGYSASLELDRRYPHREMECLAGVGMPDPASSRSGPRADCPPGFTRTNLEWQILQDGQRITPRGDVDDHSGEYSDATVGRSLGWLDLKKGATFVVQARLIGPSDKLAVARPRLRIGYNDVETLIVQGFFFSAIALILAVTGAGMLISGVMRLLKARTVREAT